MVRVIVLHQDVLQPGAGSEQNVIHVLRVARDRAVVEHDIAVVRDIPDARLRRAVPWMPTAN